MLDQEIRKHQLEIKNIEANKQEVIYLKTSKSFLRDKLITFFLNIFFLITRNIIPHKVRDFLWNQIGKKIWLFCNSRGIKL